MFFVAAELLTDAILNDRVQAQLTHDSVKYAEVRQRRKQKVGRFFFL